MDEHPKVIVLRVGGKPSQENMSESESDKLSEINQILENLKDIPESQDTPTFQKVSVMAPTKQGPEIFDVDKPVSEYIQKLLTTNSKLVTALSTILNTIEESIGLEQ